MHGSSIDGIAGSTGGSGMFAGDVALDVLGAGCVVAAVVGVAVVAGAFAAVAHAVIANATTIALLSIG